MVKKLSFPSTVLTILKAIPCQMCIYWFNNMDFQFCQPKFGALPVLHYYPCSCCHGNGWTTLYYNKAWFSHCHGNNYRGNNVKLVMHQISVDKIENPCYWINRCTFDMVLPSILSTQYWESLIFSPCIVIGEIEHFCVPRGQRRFFIKIETKASICSWEVCFCCCTH